MSPRREFRRPARLDSEEAQNIVGDQDPAIGSELAHATALALMGVPSGDFDEEALGRLREAIQQEGVDIVAPAWDMSPDFTLPGALWRLYLVLQWHEIDPKVVQFRYAEGLKQVEISGVVDPYGTPDLDMTLRAVSGVMAGAATLEDLPPILESSAALLRLLAAGSKYGSEWITQDDHELATRVTRRPEALLATAGELDESARQARMGQLT